MSKLLSPAEIADKIRANGGFKNQQPDLAKVAEEFINGPVREAIEIKIANSTITDKKIVGVDMPGPAYSRMKEFVAECNKLLAPHYSGEDGDDGYGMKTRLYVTW